MIDLLELYYMYFTAANFVFMQPVSGAVKPVFSAAKWCNLLLQIIQTQTVLSPFLFILLPWIFKTSSLRYNGTF